MSKQNIGIWSSAQISHPRTLCCDLTIYGTDFRVSLLTNSGLMYIDAQHLLFDSENTFFFFHNGSQKEKGVKF